MGALRRACAAAAAAILIVAAPSAERVVILTPTGGLPAHVAGMFVQPLAFERGPDGSLFVFDSRAHAVFRIDPSSETARKIVDIGFEDGRLLEPSAFALGPDGSFVVADGPNRRERVQIFNSRGERVGGFTLPGQNAARLTLGGLVLNGVGSLDYTGRSILISQPESGTLVTEYTLSGRPYRSYGRLRKTGYEHDRDVHLAMNAGIPLAIQDDGLYVVFLSGVPMFQRYSRSGELVYSRHIEGPEVDPLLRSMPTAWPRRTVQPGGELPLVPPYVRTAAADPDGGLWIALVLPYVYAYDAAGDKLRTIQLRGTAVFAPTSLAFDAAGRLLVTPGCYEYAVR
jgi:hypothetical protein